MIKEIVRYPSKANIEFNAPVRFFNEELHSLIDDLKDTIEANEHLGFLNDLRDWKDHVFIEQDAVDVFYINASALNSCIQLESYIKTNIQKEG